MGLEMQGTYATIFKSEFPFKMSALFLLIQLGSSVPQSRDSLPVVT